MNIPWLVQREQPSRASKPKRFLKNDSAIGQHLLDNSECAQAYIENRSLLTYYPVECQKLKPN